MMHEHVFDVNARLAGHRIVREKVLTRFALPSATSRTARCRRSRRRRQPPPRPPVRVRRQESPVCRQSPPSSIRECAASYIEMRSRSASSSRPAPNRTGSSATSPVSASAASIAARAPSSSRWRVLSAMQATGARPARQRDALVQLDELRQREQRHARIPLHLGRAREVAEHESVRGRAVDQPQRDARVGGMRDRSLALDEEELSPTLAPLDHQALGGARDEVGDDGVDRDAPARDRDAGLAGRDELGRDPAAPAPRGRARARRSSSRSRSRSRP